MQGEYGKTGSTVLDWLEFFDPEDKSITYRVNMTFMLSRWGCLFGNGCPGLLNRGVDYDRGCCERGVTFESDEDFEQVEKAVKQLTPEDWDFAGKGFEDSWFLTRNGKAYATKKKRDRCIFANMTGGQANHPGCAFYALGQRTGQRPQDLMPSICYGVPLMFGEDYDSLRDITTFTLTANDADDWGGWEPGDPSDGKDGKGYMGYWCMDTPDAFRPEHDPVYIAYEIPIRKKYGDAMYDEMKRIIIERGWDIAENRPPSRMAGEVRNDGRPMLPLLIAEHS